ncbi:preprotein translocase subunit SecB [Oceanobacillus limi]|uniref:Preprotein translocase subunit SecB n=1 Tax=Oceanobacillus limi TaxID=930131 RepID=A0A1I0HIH7_9BACI|nr:protein-export chaperone SecB [Oceanobacillus limi]SET83728.1 preprotein translocase subunit SecB [Oceanobacillus limi]
MNSTLSFNQYDVIETVYKFNPTIDLESENVSPDLSLRINYFDETRQKAVLFFEIELGDEQLKGNSFYVRAVIAGIFSIKTEDEDEDELSDDFIDHMYKKNALAILYPYMRSLVSDLSSKGSESPIILPPINIGALVDKKDLAIEEYSMQES